MRSYYVYTFQCADNSLYTSITCHLAKRLSEHHHGKRRATRNRRPLALVNCTKFGSISEAIQSEITLKANPLAI
ncbi:MAG: GIY-YIG nuclease family protein [Bacteroidetes bacterium]|nr:GIY-YIG nuclease family protein [Bacteroidota bacterium]